MKLQDDGQLLTTTISICFRGKVLQIKVMDFIQIGTLLIERIEVDVGVLPKAHKGLLGLDILKTHGFIVDLNKLELYAPCSYDR